MNVFVGTASKHGSTAEIGEAIAAELNSEGIMATPFDVADLRTATKALEHRIFAGKLDKQDLHFGERAIVTAPRAPVGDFRDWTAIQVWTKAIAAELREQSA